MPDDSDNRSTDSDLLDAAEGFLNAFGAGDEWRERVDELYEGSNLDPEQAIAAGITAGEQAARLREQSRAPSQSAPAHRSPTDEPLIHTRDIEDENGRYAGTRIVCSDPYATLFENESAVLVRTGDRDEEIPLPKSIGEVERADGDNPDGAAEWVVRPATDADPDDAGDDDADE